MKNIKTAEIIEKIREKGAFFDIDRMDSHIDPELHCKNYMFNDALGQMALKSEASGKLVILQPKEIEYKLLKKEDDNFIVKQNQIWDTNYINYISNPENIVKKFSNPGRNIALSYAFNKIMKDIFLNDYYKLNQQPHSTVFICYQEGERVRLNAVLEGKKSSQVNAEYRMAINPKIFNACFTQDLSSHLPKEQ